MASTLSSLPSRRASSRQARRKYNVWATWGPMVPSRPSLKRLTNVSRERLQGSPNSGWPCPSTIGTSDRSTSRRAVTVRDAQPSAGSCSPSVESELLVGGGGRHVRDETDGRLGDARPEGADAGLLEERGVHDLLVDELLHPLD